MLPLYEIRPTDLTVIRNKYELNFPEHMHKYIEIIYVHKGVQHIFSENKSYIVAEGCAAIIFPDTIHSYIGSKDENSEVLIILCAPKLFGSLFPDLNKFRISDPIIDSSLIHNKLKTAFEMIEKTDDFPVKFSWTCVIMSYLMEIMKPEQGERSPVSDITYKIIKYIEENFREDITRESLAKYFNVSECYISKIFTSHFNMNLRNYLGLIRAEYAANLIRTTDETFTAISQLAGFQSLRTFNRMFRSAYGISPSEYKNNINKLMAK